MEDRASPLVFVIDELDRCRPSFALELLEKIKHFFAVPGVIFVLVSSLSQLETAVRFAYGDVDARTYLEKFYHLRLLLPVPTPDRLDTTSGKYLQYLQRGYAIEIASVPKIIEQFSRTRPLSLRTLERIFTYANIAQISIPPDHWKNPNFIAVLSVIKVLNPDLYEICRTGNATFSEVEGLMRFSDWRDGNDRQTGEDAEKWWRYALGDLHNAEVARQIEESLARYSRSQPSMIVPHFCEVLDGLSFPTTVAPEVAAQVG